VAFVHFVVNSTIWKQKYAKQTQFAEHPNKRNFCYNKELRRKSAAQSRKNKPNSNPIQTQFKPNSNPIKPNFKLFAGDVTGERVKRFVMSTNERYPTTTELVTDATISTGPDRDTANFAEVAAGGTWGIYDRSNHLIRNRPVGGNVLFLDGHLKWRDFKEMEYRNNWNPWHWW